MSNKTTELRGFENQLLLFLVHTRNVLSFDN